MRRSYASKHARRPACGCPLRSGPRTGSRSNGMRVVLLLRDRATRPAYRCDHRIAACLDDAPTGRGCSSNSLPCSMSVITSSHVYRSGQAHTVPSTCGAVGIDHAGLRARRPRLDRARPLGGPSPDTCRARTDRSRTGLPICTWSFTTESRICTSSVDLQWYCAGVHRRN